MSVHVDTNKNVNWMDSRGFWTFYILLLASLYMAMPIVFPSHGDALTAMNAIHGAVRQELLLFIYYNKSLDNGEEMSIVMLLGGF